MKPLSPQISSLDALDQALAQLAALPLSPEARQAVQHAQAQSIRVRQAAEEQLVVQSKYITTAAHELRLPLTAIKGYADLLRNAAIGSLNDMQVSFLDIIRNNVGRMATLITDFSDLAKLESDRLKLDLQPVEVNATLTDLFANHLAAFGAKQQRAELHLADHLPLVLVDKTRLEQIVSSLLDNANRYTPMEGQIFLASRPYPDLLTVRIEVRDTGIGISPEDQAQLFTPFFRSEHPHVRSETGWGLSLSVGYALAQEMGGKLGLDSTSAAGSIFWLDLPCA